MAEVVEEFVAEAFAFMGAGDEASDIEELDRDGTPARDAGAVVRFATVGEIEAGAGTGNLEVADCSLWVDGCETRMGDVQDWDLTTGTGVAEKWLTGNFLRTNQRHFFMVEATVVVAVD